MIGSVEDDDIISKSSMSGLSRRTEQLKHSSILESRYSRKGDSDDSLNAQIKSSRKEMLQILLGNQMIKLCTFIL